jgi:mycothiol synthase
MQSDAQQQRYAVTASAIVPAEDRDTLLEMARQTAAEDGQPPLNDEALQAVQHPESLPEWQTPLHLTVHRCAADDTGQQQMIWVGYAYLRDIHTDPIGSLFVVPQARRAGAGRRLLAACIEAAESPIRIWAPGNSLAAQSLAADVHLHSARQLLIMHRDLSEPILTEDIPDGVTVRSFRENEDEQAWLDVNARAFAEHPEQGDVQLSGLRATMTQEWFDPADFLVAIDDQSGQMLGFHWMKQHSDTSGEVYVLGVDPDAAGRGLGKALLRVGLKHLRDGLGLTDAMLYVEGDNEQAVGLYLMNGFQISNRDVLYAQQHGGENPGADRSSGNVSTSSEGSRSQGET